MSLPGAQRWVETIVIGSDGVRRLSRHCNALHQAHLDMGSADNIVFELLHRPTPVAMELLICRPKVRGEELSAFKLIDLALSVTFARGFDSR